MKLATFLGLKNLLFCRSHFASGTGTIFTSVAFAFRLSLKALLFGRDERRFGLVLFVDSANQVLLGFNKLLLDLGGVDAGGKALVGETAQAIPTVLQQRQNGLEPIDVRLGGPAPAANHPYGIFSAGDDL
ncbi:MAG: hypothetical protein JSR91_17440 [Proteobacteria bacterium]|nr:hypothetical protein [Pseudomonadota bacterium]